MEVYNKIFDDRSEYFFGSIPRWITHFAFIAMVLLFLCLFIASYFINIPDKKQVQVYLSTNSTIVKLDYSTFNQVTSEQKVDINLPVYGRFIATLDTKNAYLSGESVYCNAQINKKLDSNKLKGTINCRGEILLSNISILKKILSN
jgi:hypothetical protein